MSQLLPVRLNGFAHPQAVTGHAGTSNKPPGFPDGRPLQSDLDK